MKTTSDIAKASIRDYCNHTPAPFVAGEADQTAKRIENRLSQQKIGEPHIRQIALDAAVRLANGSQMSAETVTEIAEVFVKWLSGEVEI